MRGGALVVLFIAHETSRALLLAEDNAPHLTRHLTARASPCKQYESAATHASVAECEKGRRTPNELPDFG